VNDEEEEEEDDEEETAVVAESGKIPKGTTVVSGRRFKPYSKRAVVPKTVRSPHENVVPVILSGP